MIWGALCLTDTLPKPQMTRCVFMVVHVAGTIKKAEEEAIRRARVLARRARIEGVGSAEDVLDEVMGGGEGDDGEGAFSEADASESGDENIEGG
jgi:ribonuclease P/MRP protein subunit POP5